MGDALLEVSHLDLHFPILGGVLRRTIGRVYAVNDVSFRLETGETLGLVGESGCGKTSLARALVGLNQPTGGEIRLDGRDLAKLDKGQLMALRREVQMVFQDPYASLNPRMTIRDTLEEPLKLHGIGNAEERRARVLAMIETVELRPEDLLKFPHQFSGGQRQRIGIARALMLEPRLLIADEPVSALDVSIQSQVLNLLVALQRRLDLTYIFISHDLTVVKYIADRVAVMYLGRFVEIADSQKLYRGPLHPYSQALIEAAPHPSRRRGEARTLPGGDLPSPSNPPPGCAFHTRCRFAQARCSSERPHLRSPTESSDHLVACHFAGELREGARSS